MFYFPQLSTGAVSQYPLTRRGTIRTIVNVLDDGRIVPMTDAGTRQTSWDLTYKDIPDSDLGSSRVDLQACKLEYSIVSPK